MVVTGDFGDDATTERRRRRDPDEEGDGGNDEEATERADAKSRYMLLCTTNSLGRLGLLVEASRDTNNKFTSW